MHCTHIPFVVHTHIHHIYLIQWEKRGYLNPDFNLFFLATIIQELLIKITQQITLGITEYLKIFL